MTSNTLTPGIAAGRLTADDYVQNFTDLHPALSDHEALVAADRASSFEEGISMA